MLFSEMTEGTRVILTRDVNAHALGYFPEGSTGKVVVDPSYVSEVPTVHVLMDRTFPCLAEWDNKLAVGSTDSYLEVTSADFKLQEPFPDLEEEFPGWPASEVADIPKFMIPSHNRHNECPSWKTPDGLIEVFVERENPEDRASPETPRYGVLAYITSTNDYQEAFSKALDARARLKAS